MPKNAENGSGYGWKTMASESPRNISIKFLASFTACIKLENIRGQGSVWPSCKKASNAWADTLELSRKKVRAAGSGLNWKRLGPPIHKYELGGLSNLRRQTQVLNHVLVRHGFH